MKALLFLTLVSFLNAAPPHILMIVSDDQGFRDIGYRHPQIKTPHLDALAAAGVRLENHYVFATCSPTRCALLTGMNPARFGILGPIGGESKQAVPLELPNLATVLKRQGYFTALSGKWHLNLSLEGGPKHYGFDSSYGYLHGQIDPLVHDYKTGKRTWHRDDVFLDEQGHATDLITAEAVRVISAAKVEQPLFLYVAYSVPHTPLLEEARWTQPYESIFPDKTRQLVAGSITHMDDGIGRIVAALEAKGMRDNTLLLFTSDNGGPARCDDDDYAGRFAGQLGPHSDNAPLRGEKGELFEGGIRVPAFVNWPSTLKPRSETAVCSAMDWLHTLAVLSGAAVPETDGVNLSALLTEGAATQQRPLFWRTNKALAVRDGPWKLIADKESDERLFHLLKDTEEKQDVAAQHPEEVQRLKSLLKAWKNTLPEKVK